MRAQKWFRQRAAWFVALAAATAGFLVVPLVAPAGAAKPAKTIGFSAASYEGTEGEGSVTIAIVRTPKSGRASVTFTASNGTGASAAFSPGDFTATTATVAFRSGDYSLDQQVPIFLDGVPNESDETVTLTLSSPSKGWSVDPSSATLTIHEYGVPGAPTNLTVGPSTPSVVHLTWTAPSGGHVNHYVVYRSTTSGGPYDVVRTLVGTGWEDNYVTSGTTYYYVVTSVSNDNATSAYSNQVSATPIFSP